MGHAKTLMIHSPPWVIWLYVLALIAYSSCWIIYGLRSPWRESRIGRAMFGLYASISAVLVLAVVARVVDLPPRLQETWLLITMTAVTLMGYAQLAAILRNQRRRRRGGKVGIGLPDRRASDKEDSP